MRNVTRKTRKDAAFPLFIPRFAGFGDFGEFGAFEGKAAGGFPFFRGIRKILRKEVESFPEIFLRRKLTS